MRKNYSVTIPVYFFFLILSFQANAQDTTARLLKQPANWSFERFALPPSFAPDFIYKGAEELRFSPGMFVKDSADYFTYAFVAQLDDVSNVSQEDIRNYLLSYYKGLCRSVATDRKLVIDTSVISVSIGRKKSTDNYEIIYNAVANIFGVFADNAPVKLNMEIKPMLNKQAKKAYLVFIASPRKKTDKVWQRLYEIQKGFVMPE